MASPVDQIVALARKGDRRVLLGGAAVIGGGVGFVVFMRNRNTANGGSSGAKQGVTLGDLAGAASSGGGGGGGGSGGGIGDLGALADLGTTGLSLPELPSLDSPELPSLNTPQLPDVTDLGDLGSSIQLPNLANTNPFSLPDLGGLLSSPIMSGFGALPELPAMPELPNYSTAYGNDLGMLPTLPMQSEAVDNLRAGKVSPVSAADSNPFAGIISAARAGGSAEQAQATPVTSFAQNVQVTAQRLAKAITAGTQQTQNYSVAPQTASALQTAQNAIQQAIRGQQAELNNQNAMAAAKELAKQSAIQQQTVIARAQAEQTAKAVAQNVQDTAQRIQQSIAQNTVQQINYGSVPQQAAQGISAVQSIMDTIARQAAERAQQAAQVQAQLAAQNARLQQEAQQRAVAAAQQYQQAVVQTAQRIQQAVMSPAYQNQTYTVTPQVSSALSQATQAVASAARSATYKESSAPPAVRSVKTGKYF